MKVIATLFALSLLSLWSTRGVKAYVSCPLPTDIGTDSSACGPRCYSDSDCAGADNSSLCCPTQACEWQCAQSLTIPYHPPILGCPLVDTDMVGTCEEDCSDCDDGELCCSNGCGHVCTTAVEVTPICQGISDSYNGTSMPGRYLPQCSEDGNFNPAQCHASIGYCWCVDPQTGVPVSSMVRSELPQCSCVHNGVLYHIGEEFPDDCNTCYCEDGGHVSCTEIGCNPPPVTEPTGFYSCPVLEEDTVGICSEECSGDTDCNSDQKCCSNGCGHTCMDPTPIPYIAPPLECPDTWDGPIVCDIQECNDSTQCQSSDQLCCANPCGSRVCVDGTLPPYPCTATVNMLTGALLGSYVPKCDESDGTFFSLQCFSHYCWCVEPSSGKPVSDMRLSTDVGELQCSPCEYNGQMYNHGDVVERHGECSKSTCLAGEIITSDGCDTCEYQGKEYHHKEYVDECKLCVCLDGAVACAGTTEPCQAPTQCVHNGVTYEPGDYFEGDDGCSSCICTDSGVGRCQTDTCGGATESENLVWWHSLLIACGIVITVLAMIALVLFIIMVLLVRNSQFRHKRLRESPSETFEPEAVSFKNGPPEAQSVELKVPVEDPEPVDT